jgi:hypothetical protein
LGAKGIDNILILPGLLIQHLPREHAGSPTSSDRRRFRHSLGEVQPHSINELPVPGVPVEHSASIFGHPQNKGGRPLFSSQDLLQLGIPHVSTSDGVDRPHRGLLQSSPISSAERKVASDKSKLSLLFGIGSIENSDSLSQARRDLQWIISLSPHHRFAPLSFLSPEVYNLEVQTDASNLGHSIWFEGFLHQGYGIWFEGLLHQGLWDSTAAGLHISVLETTALWHFLAYILSKSSKQRNILWRVDNTTALAYVKKEGVHAVHKS